MLISNPRARSGWLTICPTLPKPTMSALPCSPSGVSSPSALGATRGASRSCRITISGVSAMDTMMMATRVAFSSALSRPTATAAP